MTGAEPLLRGSTGSMCMPSHSPATSAPSARAMAIPSPVLKRARGASSGMLSPPGPKCFRIMSRLPWKPPQASTTASAARTSPLLTRTPRMPFSSLTSACAVHAWRNRTPAWCVARVSSRKIAARRRRAGCAAGLWRDNRSADETRRRATRSIAPSRAPHGRGGRSSFRRPGISSLPTCRARSSARRDRAGPCACRPGPAGIAAGLVREALSIRVTATLEFVARASRPQPAPPLALPRPDRQQ